MPAENKVRARALIRGVQFTEGADGRRITVTIPFQLLDGEHRGRVVLFRDTVSAKRTIEVVALCGADPTVLFNDQPLVGIDRNVVSVVLGGPADGGPRSVKLVVKHQVFWRS